MKQPKTLTTPVRISSFLQRASRTLVAGLALLGLVQQAGAQHYNITSNWFVTNLVANTHIATGDVNRGLAYDSISNQVFVCNKGITGSGSTPAIDVFDGTNGTYIGSANVTGVSTGTFLLDQVVVADDGVLYSANLQQTIISGFKIYRWNNWNNAPTVAFSGDPSGGTLSRRMGDNLVIKGAGASTVILGPMTTASGTQATTNVALFSTTDGATFTPTVLQIAGLPAPPGGNNGPAIAVTFYTNNTFLFKQGGTSLYLVQYPTNFASLPSPVQATVIDTNTTFSPSGNVGQTSLDYSASGSLLAAIGPIPNAAPSSTPVALNLANPINPLTSVGGTNSVHANANGNFIGGVALGGQGKTNLLFTLDCNNGVHGWGLTFVPAPVLPTITTQPVGGTFYTNLGSYTFTVSGAGSTPLYYYWQYNTVSNLATATTVFFATNTPTFTINPLTTNASGWYNVIVSNAAGTSNSMAVQLTVSAPLASAFVTKLWSLPADNSAPYLDTSYNTRGLAFDPFTMSVVVAEHAAAQIYALDATNNGQLKFPVTGDTTGLQSGSIFPLGQVGVADDGALYCCNVSSYQPGQQNGGGVDFTISRFPFVASYTNADGTVNSSNTPAIAFQGDPGNGLVPAANGTYSGGDRWGDSFAIRGGGANTQILLGTYQTISGNQFGTGPGTNICILTTMDGMNFTPTTLVIYDPTQSSNTPPSGFAYLGVAWGASNTFWTKSPGYNLRQIQYDLVAGTGTVIQSFSTTAGQGSLNDLDGLGLDVSNNILAGVLTSDVPNDLELLQIPSAGFPPQSYYQAFFPTYNVNANGNAATTIKFPYIFSLDANNGILALKYSVPLLPFHIVQTFAPGKEVLTWQTIIGRTYQLQSAAGLASPVWSNVVAAIKVNASGSLSYTNTSTASPALFYRVVAF